MSETRNQILEPCLMCECWCGRCECARYDWAGDLPAEVSLAHCCHCGDLLPGDDECHCTTNEQEPTHA